MLISDILDISKIESGRLELHEERTCLSDLTARCLRLIAPRAQEGRITIVNEVPADLPHVIADEIRLKQALLNLLSNAVKFTHAEGQIEIFGRRSESGGVELEVRDNGIGMRPEDIPVALEPFRQVDSKSTRPYEGTGLGLPLTKQLIELHGGSLIIKSEIDQGTSVTIRLPPERVLWADTRTVGSVGMAEAASAAD
jgi:signal transduction histidine kinase